MILNLFLSLLGIAIAANFVPKQNYIRFSAFLLWAAVAVIFGYFIREWQSGLNIPFIYNWVEYKVLEVDVSLSSTPIVYAAIFPVFVITLIALLINAFWNYETAKAEFVAAAVLNLAFFAALICSQNLIQLLICSSMVGVVGFYLINDIGAREKYVYYNFLADMGFFIVFAMIYSRLGNVFLHDLEKFTKLGAHRDLVAILLLISVFIKSGLFMFHNQLLDLRGITFNRMLLIVYASTPLVGVVILHKTMPLLEASNYSIPLIQLIAVLSMVWGFLNSLVNDNIKDRSTYIAMMIYGYIYSLMSFGQLQTPEELTQLILLGYLVGLNFFMIYLSSSNEVYISKMGGFGKSLKITLGLSLLVAAVYMQAILKDINPENYIWSTSLLSFGVISLAHFYNQVFLGDSKADDRVIALLKNARLYILLPMLLLLVGVAWYNDFYSPQLGYIFVGFIALLLMQPFRPLEYLADYEALQEEDYFEKFYNLIILTPIKIIGRVLWLLVDFILIERTIISSLNQGTGVLIKLTARLQSSSLWSYLLLSLLGLAIILIAYYVKG